jgi:hypothetical protein
MARSRGLGDVYKRQVVMKGDKNATGWKGLVRPVFLNRMDPSGTDTRAAIADLESLVVHDRSGAAVTAAETPRLRPFIPNATDDRATAEKKLNRFTLEYRAMVEEASDFYKSSGYKVPTDALRGSGATSEWDGQERRAGGAKPAMRFEAQGNPVKQ